MSNPQPVVLEYQRPSTGAQTRRSKWRCLPYLVAVFLPFLPFTFDSSPVDAARFTYAMIRGGYAHVDWAFGLFGATYMLAFPLLAWRIRQDFTSGVTAAETILAYSVGLIGWIAIIAIYSLMVPHIPGVGYYSDWVILLIGPLIGAAAATLIARLTRRGDPCMERPWVVMLAPYSINIWFCLVSTSSKYISWYLALIVILGAGKDFVRLLVSSYRASAR